MLSCMKEQHMAGEWHVIVFWCVNVSLEYAYAYAYWSICFCGTVFQCIDLQHISVNVSLCISLSLSWLPTQSALWRGCPKLNRMKGLVYGGSEYWAVLEQTAESVETGRLSNGTSEKCLRERVLWGKLGEWELESKMWLLCWSFIFSITGKSSWCHYISPQKNT